MKSRLGTIGIHRALSGMHLVLIAFLFFQLALSCHAAEAANLSGMITDAQTKLPIEGATVVASAGDRTYETRTDGFGMYRLEGIEPGTYFAEANHPGYISAGDAGLVISTVQQNRWMKELQLKETFFDIYVEVSCITTGMKLKNVAVSITPSDGGVAVATGKTDAMGFIHFTGLRRGFYTFSVNTGADKISGWESYTEAVIKELNGPHWADVLLKPETSQITASVYGFNPVTEQDGVPLEGVVVECEGVHPDDPDYVLVPAQVGVSAIRKENEPYWDNTIAGKVIFTGLPHINWIVQGKRLGYKLSETRVAALPNDSLRLDMALQDTQLTVAVKTPYNDPEMLVGLKVHIQGLKNSNTEGIRRVREVQYQADKKRAVAIFDKILPGNYLVTVNDSVTKTVPIMIDGVDYMALQTQYYKYNKFTVHFSGSEFVDAFADVDHVVEIAIDPEPMTFTGKLQLADKIAVTSRYGELFDSRPVAGQPLQIRASEYYLDHMPEQYRQVDVVTDQQGGFTVSLIPGLYGFASPTMDGYWGHKIEVWYLDAAGSYKSSYSAWPYYQTWPYSLKSAHAYMSHYMSMTGVPGGIGGIGFSSGTQLTGALTLRKKEFNLKLYASSSSYPPTWELVAGFKDYQAQLAGGYFRDIYTAAAVLSGPVNQTYPMEMETRQYSSGIATTRITGSVPGNYSLNVTHPRYTAESVKLSRYGDDPSCTSFEWFAFPNPGLFPESPFPEEYTGLFPLPEVVYADMIFSDKSAASEIRVHKWQPSANSYAAPYLARYDFISFGYAGELVFQYTGNAPWTSSSPYAVWVAAANSSYGTNWYKLSSPGGNLSADVYVEGPLATGATEPLWSKITYSVKVEARDISAPLGADSGLIDNVNITFFDGTSAVAPVTLTEKTDYRYRSLGASRVSHSRWKYVNENVILEGFSGPNPIFRLTVYMTNALSIRGKIVNKETGKTVTGARINFFHEEGTPYDGTDVYGVYNLLSDADGLFALKTGALFNRVNFMEVTAEGFEPFRKRLDPADAVVNPDDARTKLFILENESAIQLTPFKKPAIATDTLVMNRRGAFLPSVKKAGNQTLYTAFDAEGPLTMTWSIEVGPGQKEYSVTLPGFDNVDGSAGASQTIGLQDTIREVWLVDMKAFQNNLYDDGPIALTLPNAPEPGEIASFLKNIRTGAEGFKNVYSRRITNFTSGASSQDMVKATGKVELWKLPPDLFKPAFIVVTRLGAVNVYQFEYTGAFAGKELTGVRLPPWLAGLADILGTVSGSQVMLGDGLKNLLPKGKIIALPKFTVQIMTRATNAVDYIYSIDTQVKEGMAGKLGGIMGLAPGFMGLSLYGGMEAILRGEDRELSLRLKGGVSNTSVDKNDYTPNFLKKLDGVAVDLAPAPFGEFQTIGSYKFDPNNRPDELAVLYGISGGTGLEISASIFPVLKYIPKIGPVLYLIYKSGAIDIRALTKGLVGVRSLTGFKTVYPRQEEHYAVVRAEKRQWRRHFLGGNEVGDPVKEQDPQKVEKLEIAFGFGVGTNVKVANGHLSAKGTVEIAGDDVSWTGAPSLLVDVNPNGDWPIVNRIRGDLRAVIDAQLDLWVTRLQKKWFWKAWPIDYQFGTESTMKLIEMEITVQRHELAGAAPSEFKNELPVVVDKAPPLVLSRIASGTAGNLLLFTDMAASGGDMILKAALRTNGEDWGAPVVIAQVKGVVVAADVVALKQGGWMAVWTEIAKDQANNLYPPSKIMYSMGSADGAQWTTAAPVAAMTDVASAGRLIRHGTNTALVYTETREGPTGNGDGLSALIWEGGAWTASHELVPSAVNTFDVLGSEELSQRPSLVAYTDNNHQLHLLEWGNAISDPLLMKAQVGSALAFAQHNDRTYLAYSMKEGGIGFFQRDGGAGPWVDRGVLFPEAAPRQLSLVAVSQNGRNLVVCAWTQGEGQATNLYYGVIDEGNTDIKAVSQIAASVVGDFRVPALRIDAQSGVLELAALLQTAEGFHQVHDYRLPRTLNIPWGDINRDGMVDLQDVVIILKTLIGIGPAELPGKSLADINQSGKIDLGDVIHILRVLGTR